MKLQAAALLLVSLGFGVGSLVETYHRFSRGDLWWVALMGFLYVALFIFAGYNVRVLWKILRK